MFNTTGSITDTITEAVTHIVTQSSYVCNSYYVLQSSKAAGTKSYGYLFNHTPSCPWLEVPGQGPFPSKSLLPVFGATHTSEIPFVFGSLDRMPLGQGDCNATIAEHKISNQLKNAWTAMAESGRPTTKALQWPEWDSCKRKGILVEGKVVEAKLDFQECGFWGDIWQEYAGFKFPGVEV